MRICRLFVLLGTWCALSGCVIGYGHCLLLEPIKNKLTGKVHFRSFPAADGVDNVPVLTLDTTAYLYAPAQSRQCIGTDDIQLVGVSEFPQNVVENSHVRVEGKLFQQSSSRDHTPFLMNVTSLLPLNTPH
jgi:hypothetical protein